MRVASRFAERLKTEEIYFKEISGKSQNFIELFPSAQSSFRNENFVNISKKLLKNRNWTFPVVGYFTRKLEFASNILRMIVTQVFYFSLSFSFVKSKTLMRSNKYN